MGTEILSRKISGAAPVQDDVIDTDLERRIEVFFDVLRGKLEANRDTTRLFAHLSGEIAELIQAVPIGKARR